MRVLAWVVAIALIALACVSVVSQTPVFAVPALVAGVALAGYLSGCGDADVLGSDLDGE